GRKAVERREDRPVAFDRWRSNGVDNHDRFAGAVQAGGVEGVHVVYGAHVTGAVSARRQVAESCVVDVGAVSISGVGGSRAAAREGVRLEAAETGALEECTLRDHSGKWPGWNGLAVSVNRTHV